MRIQAAVLRDPQGPFTIEDLDLADPAPHQILVEVAAVGHCHTDVLPRAQIGFGAPPIVLSVTRARGSFRRSGRRSPPSRPATTSY